MSTPVEQLVIIGSGPAGLSAAIYAARADLKPLVFEGNKPGGQLMGTTVVENWPGTESIMGPQLMMDMKKHAETFGTRLIAEQVTHVDLKHRPFTISSKKQTVKARSLIIATGATPKRLNVPGEEDYWGKGVTTCAVCDGAFYKDVPVIVVGGGDTAMEDASFMTKFTNNITIVHILDALTASAAMQKRVLDHPDINIMYNSTVSEIQGDGTTVTGVTVTNQKTNQSSQLDAKAVFVAIGYKPNTALFKEQIELNEWGYINTDGTQTSLEGVFAAGDVADSRYRQAITSAGSGCMAALDAERWLSRTS